jgi:hypothetical protein
MGMALQAEILPDYFEKLQARILQEFTEGVDAWGHSVTALSRWEADYLLDNPGADDLAIHRRIVDRLIHFGCFLALTTEHPDFPDIALKQNVAATLQTLRDKIPLWHGTMPQEEAASILRAAFPG